MMTRPKLYLPRRAGRSRAGPARSRRRRGAAAETQPRRRHRALPGRPAGRRELPARAADARAGLAAARQALRCGLGATSTSASCRRSAPGRQPTSPRRSRPRSTCSAARTILYVDAFLPNRVDLRAERRSSRSARSRSSRKLSRARAVLRSCAGLRASLSSVLSYSFFITKKMRTQLRRAHLSGTLPILYVFLARSGKTHPAR